MNEKKETWTLTIECSVFAGDMDKESVIAGAEEILKNVTDGSDIMGITVIDAKRDE